MTAVYDKIYLASNSPRRQDLLTQLGVEFIQLDNQFDETPLIDENARDYVERLALGKALSSKTQLSVMQYPILAADTIVVLEGKLLGKPKDLNDASQMLKQLSGNTHQVMTSVVMLDSQQTRQATSISQVSFSNLTESQIQNYCQTKESLGKAGSYAIQGVAASFVERIEGSYSGIVGLPLNETRQLLEQFQVKYLLS